MRDFMLSGRIAELQYLDQYYEKTGSQILVVYGQRHIGKTALLKEFAEDRQSHYYLAKPCSEREQMYQWGMQIRTAGMDVGEFPALSDILEALCAQGGKKIIMIDEFQNLAKTSESFMRELVRFTNGLDEKNGVMVLLGSSSIGWIENSMITRIGESARSLSGLLKVRALSFHDIVHRFPDFRIEECVEAYSILGGFPGLWNQFDDRLSIQQNICRHILNRDSCLFEEWERMVAEQLRETSVYNTILAAIASGKYKLNEIYLHTGFSRAKISVYLKNLMELELVEKVYSYDMADKENAQKGIYRIIHPFVNFYFTYLYPNMSALQTVSVGEFYNQYIYPCFKKYVSGCFKQVCREHLARMNKRGRLPIQYVNSGEWVGKEGTIDFIAQDTDGKTLIALCNWEKAMMTYEDYEWLLSYARKVKLSADYIYLYTASGFDERLDLEAKVKKNLKLIQITDI